MDLEARLEGAAGETNYSGEVKKFILERLTAAEGLERYLHTKFVGQKRFSLEGGETLIPLLHHLLQRAGAQGVKETVIGMAHRGRLNVLANIMAKAPADIFAEFEDIDPESMLGGGDVCSEMSLLTHRPAMATIAALTKCWALMLGRHESGELILTYPNMLVYISDLVDRRQQPRRRDPRHPRTDDCDSHGGPSRCVKPRR